MSMLRPAPWREISLVTAVFASALIWMFTASAHAPSWELANPIVPLPAPPLGIDGTLTDLKEPPTPERVRLVMFLGALRGEGYQDSVPHAFPGVAEGRR